MLCDTNGSFSHLKLFHCGCGAYHMTLGMTTLRMTEDELVMVARSIHQMAARHPALQARLVTAVCGDLNINALAGGPDAH